MKRLIMASIDYTGIAALVTAVGSVIVGVWNLVRTSGLGQRTKSTEQVVAAEQVERRAIQQNVVDLAKQLPPPSHPNVPTVPQFSWSASENIKRKEE